MNTLYRDVKIALSYAGTYNHNPLPGVPIGDEILIFFNIYYPF